MDPRLVGLEAIDQETRHRIFMYLWEQRRISSRDLGISPSMANKIKNRKAKITNAVLAKLIEHLSPEEFAKLTGGPQPLAEVNASTVLRVLRAALADPALRDLVVDIVLREVGYELRELTRTYYVTERDVERFKRELKSRARKTYSDRLRYLLRALKDLNYTLTPEKLNEYILELAEEEGPNVARHVATTLKLFLKTVLKPRDHALYVQLYGAFKVPKQRRPPKQLLLALGLETKLMLEDVKKVFKAIEDPGAKAFFALLAETGLRPCEVYELELSQLDLENRVVKPLRITETKRAFLSFFTVKTKEYLKTVYLSWREQFVKRYVNGVATLGQDVEKYKRKLFPVKESTLRARIKQAMERAGVTFQLYELRSFFASWFWGKVPETMINLWQGRLGRKDTQVLLDHYLRKGLEELREIYDNHVFDLWGS